jgi:hypothetical protein
VHPQTQRTTFGNAFARSRGSVIASVSGSVHTIRHLERHKFAFEFAETRSVGNPELLEIPKKPEEEASLGRQFVPPMARDRAGRVFKGYSLDHLLNSSPLFCVRLERADLTGISHRTMSAFVYFDTAGRFRQLSTPRVGSLIVTSALKNAGYFRWLGATAKPGVGLSPFGSRRSCGADLAANQRRIFSCAGGETSKEILWASWKAVHLGGREARMLREIRRGNPVRVSLSDLKVRPLTLGEIDLMKIINHLLNLAFVLALTATAFAPAGDPRLPRRSQRQLAPND